MADISLPELKPAKVDYVNAFAKGYAAPAAMQAPDIVNTINQQKIVAEQNKQNALSQYAKTGDEQNLIAASPEIGLRIAALKAERQKAETAAMLPGLKMAYAYSDALKNPDTYQQTRGILTSASPWLAKYLPPEWNETIPGFVDQQKTGVEKLFKLSGESVPYYDAFGNQIGSGPKGAVQFKAPPKSYQELRQEAEAKSAGRWSGRPPTTILGTDPYGLTDRSVSGPVVNPRAQVPTDQSVVTTKQAIEQGSVPKGTRIVNPGKSGRSLPGSGGATSGPTKDVFDSMGATNGQTVTFQNGQKWRWVNDKAEQVQ